ncbi:MAG: hypothetical protein IPN69_18515 [Acidobacteria bacterium]|nr:hypothetical protein [Acidobacteriota bacterium]
MERRIAKVEGRYLQGEPNERFSGTISFESHSDCIYYQWRINTKDGEWGQSAIPVSFRVIPEDGDSFEYALEHSIERLRRYRSNRQKVFYVESWSWLHF